MSDTKEKLKGELNKLMWNGKFLLYYMIIDEGLEASNQEELLENEDYGEFVKSIGKNSVSSLYQKWYSQSLQVVKQLLPDRLQEFKNLYQIEKRNIKDFNLATYTISDFFIGLALRNRNRIDCARACLSKFDVQTEILNSCLDIIESKLVDIEGILQYELYENELETAKDIFKKKHYRVSGALAGITLEGHLKKVCENHQIKLKKSHPTISEYNELLKENSLIDLATWRLIQRLGDIRNMSVHAKERDPKPDEVEDLIRGCEKLIAELN